jgi:hypothetical protein
MIEGYFAARSAPLGAPTPGAVTATFYSFHPGLIRKFLRSDISFADALDARRKGAGRALKRMLGDEPLDLTEVTAWLKDLVDAAPPEGRALFAGHAELDWPDDPVEALWHGTNTMREFRGDGHLAVLLTHDLTGIQAHVLRAGASDMAEPENSFMVRGHGWKPDEYKAAAALLHERGLTEADGSISEAGRRLRGMIEQETDHLAQGPYLAVGEERSEAMLNLLAPISKKIVEAQGVPGPVVKEALTGRSSN